jgi:AmmeMemoRadiSam system radical SAM enzyme/AmmeMemoRadiSam system protein B/AmmeMemoRadiSam system protein A
MSRRFVVSCVFVADEIKKEGGAMASRVANESLADAMDRRTVVGDSALWWAEGDRLRCVACGHRCLIGEGLRGICKVRVNEAGKLKVPFGYVAGLQCDPVEKKPFFHVYPGSDALTFGMLGCDLHCAYCQNWVTSQALRDSQAVAPLRPVTPEQLVLHARREKARLVVSSYNEPLITAEWAVSVFREATAAGLACAFVSNGNATPEVLDFLRPWLSAYKIDLKSFSDRTYRTLGGTLDNITRTIGMVHERGLWLEVVTLIIPGLNDSEDELRRAARFLASVSRDIPWHVTAFHKDYRMTDPDATSADMLIRAAKIGAAEGLRFIYAGNLPGRVGPWENTRCPSCRGTLIERFGYLIRSYRLGADGCCPDCGTRVPGVWPGTSGEVRTGNDMAAYQGRLPRRVETVPEAVLETREPAGQGEPAMLSAEQKEQVGRAAALLLRADVDGSQADFPGELAAVGEQRVAGAFVCLKRGRHLRSCCGLLGQPVSLRQALELAAHRTVWEDARFPPVAPAELDHLDMEIWLLGNLQPVAAQGEDRLGAVSIGKHGVQVVRGQAQGLFLPSVAVESNWDSRRFLDQVCIKAGLPPTAWKDDATHLFIFEGESIRVSLAGPDGARSSAGASCFYRAEDLHTYTAFCRGNLAAHLTGATPSYYLVGAPDGNVSGVVLQIGKLDGTETLRFSQISLRPGVPLQATLSSLAQAAAQNLASRGIQPETLQDLELGLLLLSDAMLHGTVADPHLAGIDPAQRAVLVLERHKAGLLFDPERSPDDLLAEAAGHAQVTNPATATIVSLHATSNVAPVSFSTAPRPVRGPAIRPAALAGTFYEAEPAALARTVDRLLEGNGAEKRSWPAALVPHAGLKFSGRIAADVLRRIEIPDTVIVIGPKHTSLGMEWAVAPHQTWALPGGSVESDVKLARRLCEAVPGLELDAAAHQREHAVEVELPLLARLAPRTKVVGIAIGHGDLESCRRFAQGLADLLRNQADRPLLLISSDMNHFATDAENRRLDALALAALERGDPAELYATVTQNQISMCGVLPAVIVLETLRLLGGTPRAERVGYATTADVTGETSRVVGYAGMLFA